MRHDARYGTAIGLLDEILGGAPAEKVLTNWARANRYAGSKDRAAVRDIVFDCLRSLESYRAVSGLGGARGVLLGQVIASGQDPRDVFTGQRHAPDPLTQVELAGVANGCDGPVWDVPGWLVPMLQASLGGDFEHVMAELRQRAPVDLRVNLLKATVTGAIEALAKDDIAAELLAHVPFGLRVKEGERKVARSKAYLDGRVELQDAGSQAVVAALPLDGVGTVLDYCAGGGGKTLAIASATRDKVRITAFDKSRDRLGNLKERAKRAGASVALADTDPAEEGQQYDLVLLDVPCSGSGAWRRNPDAKWKFSPEALQALTATQDQILESTAPLVEEGGSLAYVTCSLLRAENEDRIAAFLDRHAGWRVRVERRFPLGQKGDGFYLCVLGQEP